MCFNTIRKNKILSKISEFTECKTYMVCLFQEPEPDEREGDWCLVNHEGYNFTLPKTMIFLGREECDIELQVCTELQSMCGKLQKERVP